MAKWADFETHPVGTTDRIKELESQLAKAVEALKDLADCVDDGCFCSEMHMAAVIDKARATIEELKGQDDE
jgi:Tfp pilus assembly protein PilN